MLQFLTYLLHKQIIEMRRSQNLRCPFSVPSRRLWVRQKLGMILENKVFQKLILEKKKILQKMVS